MAPETYDAAAITTPAVGPRPGWLLAPLAAMAYPLPLAAFHAAVGAIDRGAGVAAWAAAATSLLLAFAVPVAALLAAVRLSAVERPSLAELRARRVAFLAVATPPLFTATGVLLFMLGHPARDGWLLAAFWGVTIAFVARGARLPAAARSTTEAPGRLRHAHGVVAALLLLAFLLPHLGNHLAGLVGPGSHRAIMAALRHLYRARLVEPVLLIGFLFLVVSGARMAWALSARPADGFRAFQLASGVYLLFFLGSHVNAVLVLARSYLGIDSDWGFATGAPAGLVRDAWNIRLVPLYTLAVFFALAHPFSGAREVMLAHGAPRRLANGVAVWGAALSAVAAVVIALALCGLRIAFP